MRHGQIMFMVETCLAYSSLCVSGHGLLVASLMARSTPRWVIPKISKYYMFYGKET